MNRVLLCGTEGEVAGCRRGSQRVGFAIGEKEMTRWGGAHARKVQGARGWGAALATGGVLLGTIS